MKNNKLTKSAIMTDIHFGAKSNSSIHNNDCINYLTWFCKIVKSDPKIDHVVFLGDWHENRSALNISTLNYSYKGAKMLNALGLPVYFIIGNHDLYYRHSRDIHSTINFEALKNFKIIETPTIVDDIGTGVLMCPYLFQNEYENLKNYNNINIWFGHFEFRGFIVTGYNIIMPTGPEANNFQGPKYIFSGHFHKRQAHENVVYIGNAFPTNFGDAGDNSRGMCIFNHETQEVTFKDWEDCPKYIKTTLSEILEMPTEKKDIFFPQGRVKCVVDIPISFEESTYLREKFMEKYNLREFSMEESPEIRAALSETESNIDWDDTELASVNDLVLKMLKDIESEHIDNELLISIYKNLKIQ